MIIKTAAFVVAAIAIACTPPATQVGGAGHDPNLITREDIASIHATNAYDAISALRPAMLRFRGTTTISGTDTGYPKVYLNHQLYGDIQSLRSFDTGAIRSITYYNSADASTRFGLGNASGAIEIITDAQ